MEPGYTALVIWKHIGTKGQCHTCRKPRTAIIPARFNMDNLCYENYGVPIGNAELRIREWFDHEDANIKIEIEKRERVETIEITQHTIVIAPSVDELSKEHMFN